MVSPDFFTAVVGANSAALIAVAIGWREAVAVAESREDKQEGVASAVLALLFSGIAIIGGLLALLNSWTSSSTFGGVLLLLTFVTLGYLVLLFIPGPTQRFRRWRGNRRR